MRKSKPLLIMSKICPRCKKIFPATTEYFYLSKEGKDGLRYYCKKCTIEMVKIYYQKNKEIILERTKRYRQKHRYHYRKLGQKYREKNSEYFRNYRLNHKKDVQKYHLSAIAIYSRIGRNRKHLVQLSKQEFIDWYQKQEQKCTYCGIPENLLKLLKWGNKIFRLRLTIDRKDNTKNYTLDNICLCCSKCNFIKGDILTYQEMKKIGKKYIQPKWKKKLQDNKKI